MQKYFLLSAYLLMMFTLSACAEGEFASHFFKEEIPSDYAQGNFKVGNPYQIDGQWYFPEEKYSYTETGIASWYGPGFHGARTANGEVFDSNELTAAHRTLQMPSLVRVTNLDNGRSLIVRVNDRGPFSKGRVIDVSSRAAELLGFKGKGTAKVKLQVLTQESLQLAEAARQGRDTAGTEIALNQRGYVHPISEIAPPPPQPEEQPILISTAPPSNPQPVGHVESGRFMPEPVVRQTAVVATQIYIQAGAFADSANAYRHAETLRQLGRAQVFPATVHGQQFYRVRLGPVPNVAAADSLLAKVVASGQSKAIIIVD